MPKAIIDPLKCIRCPKCYAAKECPLKAIIRIGSDDPNVVDMTFCRGCGDCIAACPAHAISIKNS